MAGLPRRRFDSTIVDDWLHSRGHGRKLDIEELWVPGLGTPASEQPARVEASSGHPLQPGQGHQEPVRLAQAEAAWVRRLRRELLHRVQRQVRILPRPHPVARRP